MSKQERLLMLSDLMLLAVAVVWGISYGVVKSALVFYPVLSLLALRFGITFVILSPALRHLRAADARTLRGVLVAGVSLLMGSEPAFGALFACIWLGERISVTAWVGGVLIVAASILATVRWTALRVSAAQA